MIINDFTEFGTSLSMTINDKMLSFVKENKIPIITAPEIKIPYNIICLNGFGVVQDIVAFNPKIVYISPDMESWSEKCFSYPGLIVKIQRAKTLRLRYSDYNGQITTVVYNDILSFLFQHAFTHLKQYQFWKDANFLNKNKAIKDWKKLERKQKYEQ